MLRMPTRGSLDAVHVGGDDRAHHGELKQVLGGAFGVRAEIEHVRVAVAGANARDDRRPIDAFDGLEHEARRSPSARRCCRR